ncbi:MAG: hypothetical protein OEY88_11245 [Candidatus Bathyarchaeota archaeon]|nr:hypothetical protein [Candidatus Bathyarchaeota archaeon]
MQKTKKGKPTKPKSAQETDEREAFKEEIVEYDIPKEMSEELFSHARDTLNFQAELKGKVYYFGDIAVLTFEEFDSATARLVNANVISIVTERREHTRFVKK